MVLPRGELAGPGGELTGGTTAPHRLTQHLTPKPRAPLQDHRPRDNQPRSDWPAPSTMSFDPAPTTSPGTELTRYASSRERH